MHEYMAATPYACKVYVFFLHVFFCCSTVFSLAGSFSSIPSISLFLCILNLLLLCSAVSSTHQALSCAFLWSCWSFFSCDGFRALLEMIWVFMFKSSSEKSSSWTLEYTVKCSSMFSLWCGCCLQSVRLHIRNDVQQTILSMIVYKITVQLTSVGLTLIACLVSCLTRIYLTCTMLRLLCSEERLPTW